MILFKKCIYCFKIFFNHPCQTKGSRTWIAKKYCSINCANKHLHSKPKVFNQCLYCKKEFRVKPSHSKWNMGKYCSKICKYKQFSINSTGSQNHQWRGDLVGYQAVHDWVRNTRGTPKFCEHCKITTKKMYHWANISKKYRRATDDWIRLCVPCHKIYDGLTFLKLKKETQ